MLSNQQYRHYFRKQALTNNNNTTDNNWFNVRQIYEKRRQLKCL